MRQSFYVIAAIAFVGFAVAAIITGNWRLVIGSIVALVGVSVQMKPSSREYTGQGADKSTIGRMRERRSQTDI